MESPLAPHPAPTTRIALLVDADNVSADQIGKVMKELEMRGTVTVRRAYGNWARPNLRLWPEALRKNAIEAVHLFNVTNGKNATDIRLVIDAMEIFLSSEADAFALVSSDSDFTPLCVHLRGAGKEVYGFGESKTAKPFVQSCTSFHVLDASKSSPEKVTHHTPPAEKPDPKLIETLHSAINKVADGDGWASLGQIGNELHKPGPFNVKEHGFPTLKKLFCASKRFEFKAVPTGKSHVPKVRTRKSSPSPS